jgi:hypothetical protein
MQIKMNYIKTMLCGNFLSASLGDWNRQTGMAETAAKRSFDLLSTLEANEFAISIKEPETVSRFLGNITIQIVIEINFKVFIKLLRKHKLKSITIDIDSSVVNVEDH